ncbi:MAG: cbb3-type cytochrome c oxidase subunit I [Candidatus Dormiibacterota bacterium]
MSERLLLLRSLRAQRITRSWLVTSGLLLLGLALAGGVMRVAQASGGNLLTADVFYEVMSVHGSGMVAVGLMAGAAVLWYLMSDEIEVSVGVHRLVYLLTLTGMLSIVVAVMVFGYSSAWTFLYPLPEHPGSGVATASIGAAGYMTGLALVVVGFLLWCADFLRAGLKRCGSLPRLLGLYVFSGAGGHGPTEEHDPTTTNPSLIAGTVVSILGLSACVIGALIVVLMLISLVYPSLTLSALVAKNMIYYTGHTLANLQIYVAAGIAYSVLPVYTKRPWRLSRALVAGWLATLAIVMLAFFHHLYQDFAQPEAVQWVGNVASYAAAIPPMTVTIYGGLVQVWRSGIRWSAAPLFTFMAMAGWAIGGFGAVIDSTISLNQFLHNTLWVPAHFHTYMAMGVMFFLIGAVYHLIPALTGRRMRETIGRRAALLMTAGGYGLVLCWYISGSMSAPRRYLYPLSGTEVLALIGAACAVVALVGVVMVCWELINVFLASPRIYLPELAPSEA